MKVSKIISRMVVVTMLASSTFVVASEADKEKVSHVESTVVDGDAKVQTQEPRQEKNLHDEIARRMTIISIAEGSSDKVLIAEADIARAELLGYQRQRADRMGLAGIPEADDLASTSPAARVVKIQQGDSGETKSLEQLRLNDKWQTKNLIQIGLMMFFSFLVGFFLRDILWK